MNNLEKNRQRLLVISQSEAIRNDLVTLLTGYGYYVDYAMDRRDGLRKYRQHRQAVVICDFASLPKYPERLFRLFQAYHQNPIILIAATGDQEALAYPYLSQGVYDIVHLPLKLEYLHLVLRRMVHLDHLSGHAFFLQMLLAISLLGAPVWMLLVYVLARGSM